MLVSGDRVVVVWGRGPDFFFGAAEQTSEARLERSEVVCAYTALYSVRFFLGRWVWIGPVAGSAGGGGGDACMQWVRGVCGHVRVLLRTGVLAFFVHRDW
jgi:hypothetical protein